MAWYGFYIIHNGDHILVIPQACLCALVTALGICSEPHVSRVLDSLSRKCVLAATASQMAYLRMKDCLPQHTSRCNLLSHPTMVAVAQQCNVSARILQELQALDPVMAAAATSSRAQEAAAQAVGVPSAAAAAAIAANEAAAATSTRPPPAASTIAAAIPATLPVQLPVVILTDAELHVTR